MNKEQTLKELLKENYLVVKSKVFEKLSYEIVFNSYTDRTVVFYNVLDEENDKKNTLERIKQSMNAYGNYYKNKNKNKKGEE